MPNPFVPELEEYEIQLAFPTVKNIKIIKSGGEGTVIKCYFPKINSDVAIKLYSASHVKTRSEREVKKLLKINSPYIVKLYDYGEVNIRGSECFYTITEWLNGNDLKHYLNGNSNLSEKEVKKLILQVSSAIDALWKVKVVHCDIKPDNIMIHNNNYVLIDLGMSKHLDEKTITMAGTIFGTLGYLAPEQFSGRKNITFRADYYSLGITAYQLLTGTHPYNGDQHQIINAKTKPVIPNYVQADEKLKLLICKLLEPIPFNRPLNYFEIENYLQ